MTQKDHKDVFKQMNNNTQDDQSLTAEELLAKLEENLGPRRQERAKKALSKRKSEEQKGFFKGFLSNKNPKKKSSFLGDSFQDDKALLEKEGDRAKGWFEKNHHEMAAESETDDLADQSLKSFGQTSSDSAAIQQTVAEGLNTESESESVGQPATKAKNDNQALVRGSFWLSLGNIVSRLLGAAFILPWLAMFGAAANQANALFSQGYNIYGILLSVATFGFPSAISKVMAQLIAKEDDDGLWSLTKQSLQIGTLLGICFAVLLYVAAPVLSNGNPNVVPVLHSLAPAVLVFPAMSMVRGVFQGHQVMHISALSEIVEQVGRIIYLLVATWVVLSHDGSNWTGAVVQATFAAFVGALFAIAVLAYGWVRYKKLIHPRKPLTGSLVYHREKKSGRGFFSLFTPDKAQSMVLSILKESWPFVIIGASTNLFLAVDQYSFFPLMKAFFHSSGDNLQVQFALFSANPNKLVMIVISFATSIAATALPILAAKKAAGDLAGLKQQLMATLQLTALVLLPSALGMYAIADVLYKFFYPIDDTAEAGIYLLQFSALLTIVMALFMLLAFVLQALSQGKVVMRAFGYGLLIKLVTQIPLIYLFQGMGALIATGLGLGWSLYQMLFYLFKAYDLSFAKMNKTLLLAYLSSGVMALIAYLTGKFSVHFLLGDSSKLGAGLATFLSVGVGAVVLLFLYKRFGLLRQVLNRGKVN
ncbi:putative polysaccharide biosynthesis protein [Fructobacillus fructosus]|uniref:Membrane protein involved in the export of O-antigen and teichoic acid (RfbX) n=1 Tax=Fructobacillus fructosus TaxID=1631 RepID=A0ABM9MYB7_9LACO|nr:polysaccharide biosynthesis protein [Fructobacillus fructosus]MBD9364886.1 polysaccharide biosynthesis protein [Leuconostoc mesenteroides]KRN51734.1 polysaccharide transporter [Fructobacillus fructosus KCTC 3544]MBC9118409.1 polysaccharide biosynthesis protein [Fructobacillus fructosus]MCK8638741.1 polysaccharide biosynthesis protein [Fructobacillus fructosus]CAK1248870.1 Membrane protein involved in the export of O-antigen and teichoic acid (RfbX) [Fructobacillus fructosus]